MITVTNLTKRYGTRVAVDDLSFTVPAGAVTGFLGPNGAGKSTTMRLLLGLDRPTSGTATIGGRPYAALDAPLRHVGAVLDARALHPSRTARDHLRWVAATHGIGAQRVRQVLDLVGLGDAGDAGWAGSSLGMRQRLALACALVGDPRALVLDEPMNGLDAEGVRWVRDLLRRLAAEGRAVLVSSHLMSEMAQLADQLVIIGRGRLLAAGPKSVLVRPGAQLEDVYLRLTEGAGEHLTGEASA